MAVDYSAREAIFTLPAASTKLTKLSPESFSDVVCRKFCVAVYDVIC